MTVHRVANPPNPWASRHVEWLGEPPIASLEVYEEAVQSMLSENDSPDLPFRFSVNPYRGCFHGCAYCYARPGHQWLGFGAGTDFERRIVVKVNAPEILADELRRGRAAGETLTFSGVTDCYQPLEASYALTRGCLEACLRFRRPVTVVTKGALVERDVALLAELHRSASALAFISVPFADEELARAIEPSAPSPKRRLQALATLALAGVPAGVALAPVIPGLNDEQIPRILSAAADAGARAAFLTMLRLPAEVEEVFVGRLQTALPLRSARVLAAIRAARGGKLSESRFGARMRGTGPRWQATLRLFEVQCARLGLRTRGWPAARQRRPTQRTLFGPGGSVENAPPAARVDPGPRAP